MGDGVPCRWSTEAEFVEAVKSKDREAVLSFFSKVSKRMMQVLLPHWRDPRSVEDAIQESFARFYENSAGVHATTVAALASWLLVVANRYLLDDAKKAERKRSFPASSVAHEGQDPGEIFDALKDDGPTAVELLERMEVNEQVAALIDQTKSPCPDILRCFYMCRMELKDIAARLSLTIDQVKKRKTRCLQEVAQMAISMGLDLHIGGSFAQ